jgi:hypothetical protein
MSASLASGQQQSRDAIGSSVSKQCPTATGRLWDMDLDLGSVVGFEQLE